MEIPNIRDFEETELTEISSYILNSTPYTERVIQSLYPLTDNPANKATVFCASYRVVETAMNFLEKDNIETKAKLQKLLDYVKDIYMELYSLLLNKNNNFSYGQSSIDYKIINILNNYDKNSKINHFINIFLVFSEKHELLSTKEVVGLELDTPEGKEVYKSILMPDDNKIQ